MTLIIRFTRASAMLLRMLLLTAFYGWCPAASADIDAVAEHAASMPRLPDEVASSVGPWRDRHAWRDLDVVAVPALAEPPVLLPLTPAKSPMWGLVDTASVIAATLGMTKQVDADNGAYKVPRWHYPIPVD